MRHERFDLRKGLTCKGICRLRSVEDPPAARIGVSLGKKASTDTFVELHWFGVDPILVREPREPNGWLDIEEQRQVRLQAASGIGVQLPQELNRQPPSVALIGHRGIGVTIAEHDLAAGQRGLNDLLDVLGPVSKEQEQLRLGRKRISVQQRFANASAEIACARLARANYDEALRSQGIGNGAQRRGLTRTLRTLEGHEHRWDDTLLVGWRCARLAHNLQMGTATAGAPPRWDLSVLFEGLDDPRIEQAWESVLARAEAFAQAYRGKIDSPDLSAGTLVEAIRELEALIQEASKAMHFGELMFAANTADPKIGAFLQQQREFATELNVKVLFFELELQAAPADAVAEALQSTVLENYRHYVSVVRAHSPHRLSEPEEIILEETANTGCRAWIRLFEEVTSNTEYAYTDPRSGEENTLTQEEVLNLLRDPDRTVRQAAADSLSAGLKSNERVSTFIYNTLLQDASVGDRLRKHPYPEHSRHLSNELDQETVELVVRLCRQHYGLVERFYRVKRKILGLQELTHIDRYAPLFEATQQVDWERGKAIVLDAFGVFSPEMRDQAGEFFDRAWIDGEPRMGKSGGAFCAYLTPDTHPVVLMSYLGKIGDVMTLAHELGHGVHASLSRAQSYFNFQGTLPLAELASIFGEMLVFESVTSDAELKDKVALYAEKIEGIFASVFRQAAMYQFEQACHRARRESGELTAEQFGELWQERVQEMFGDSVKLGEQHRGWWSYVGHFYFAPFYVYAYAFGELLALALYQKAKADGPEFAERYVRLLEMGGSRSPKELMGSVDVDLGSEAFWLGGFAVLEGLVGRFETLWAEYSG